MNPINISFETYIIINDEEFKCEVSAFGEICNDSFDHEFGTQKYKNYIDEVYIDSIVNTETNEEVQFSSLDKKQKNNLLELAYDYLVDEEDKYNVKEYY